MKLNIPKDLPNVIIHNVTIPKGDFSNEIILNKNLHEVIISKVNVDKVTIKKVITLKGDFSFENIGKVIIRNIPKDLPMKPNVPKVNIPNCTLMLLGQPLKKVNIPYECLSPQQGQKDKNYYKIPKFPL